MEYRLLPGPPSIHLERDEPSLVIREGAYPPAIHLRYLSDPIGPTDRLRYLRPDRFVTHRQPVLPQPEEEMVESILTEERLAAEAHVGHPAVTRRHLHRLTFLPARVVLLGILLNIRDRFVVVQIRFQLVPSCGNIGRPEI